MKPNTITKILSKFIVLDGRVSTEDTVFLASMGRSGSTFLSNVINYDNRHRVLFEPFRYDMVREAKCFKYPLYLRPDDQSHPDCLASAHKIISGRVHSQWVDKENASILPKARLIKDIRANFFLKWLHDNFPGMKIILLLRHPCAVTASWISNGFGDGQAARERLLSNREFIHGMDESLISGYRKADTDFERIMYLWCFSYHVPFKQFHAGDIYPIFYEQLVLNPEDEIRNLFSFLGYGYSEEEVLKSLARPSSTTAKKRNFFETGAFRLDHWRDGISEEQYSRSLEIMRLFGMGDLYCPSTFLPNPKAISSLLK
jgi:hypothetical protein